MAAGADHDTPPVDITLGMFPLLPLGEAIWTDATASLLQLDVLIPRLSSALLMLTGTNLRAAAVIIRGAIADALWVDEDGASSGAAAAAAIIDARDGRLSGYTLPDHQVAEALTMLWRLPCAHTDVPLRWLDSERFLDDIANDRVDRVVQARSAAGRGVGIFIAGRLVAAYSDAAREPTTDIAGLHTLLSRPDGTVSVLQRARDRVGTIINDGADHLRGDALNSARGAPAAAPAAARVVTSTTPFAASAAVVDAPPQPDHQMDRVWNRAANAINPPGAPHSPAGREAGINFAAIKADLITIGVRWLGPDDVRPIAALIQRAPAQVVDIVATIGAITSTPVAGHDPAVIRAMAREMHYYAAEALSGS